MQCYCKTLKIQRIERIKNEKVLNKIKKKQQPWQSTIDLQNDGLLKTIVKDDVEGNVGNK